MDYEKKYKEALERARNIHKDAIDMGENIRAKQCEVIFPELAESEDEKVRKFIIELVRQSSEILEKKNQKRMLAWLEKQGEQKPYGQREECLDCQVNYAGECKGSCAMKRGEQKPAWSEEDEVARIKE